MTNYQAISSNGRFLSVSPDKLIEAMQATPALAQAVCTLIEEAELMGFPPTDSTVVERRKNPRSKLSHRGAPLSWDVFVGNLNFGHFIMKKQPLYIAQSVQNIAQVVIELRKVEK